MSSRIFSRGFVAACAALCLMHHDAQADWPQPDRTCRPWTYNWWLGSAVDKENLSRELKRYADAGLGGIHIIPIYGVKGAESRSLEFLSPQWMEMMAFVVKEAERLGLGVDMSTGSGWCFGGPDIPAELGGRRLVVQRFPALADGKLPRSWDRKRVTMECVQAFEPKGERQALDWKPDGTLAWRPPAPGWQVVALGHESTGVKVKRAAPGGAGLMIDPFDPDAMRKHLERFTAAFATPDAIKPRAMYHDSYEYYGANWSPKALDAFAKRRGYRLQDELEAFAGQGDADRVARVRCDYRETLSDLLIEEVFPIWTDWCRQRGIATRNQAHGAPVNLLDFYALADIPETEMFGHGGPDPLVSRFDEHLGKADREPLLSKFASSAAHTAGKPLTSSETGTWLAEHFCESFEELKGLVDLLFLSGVNHVFYHGCAYSPDDTAWPGWLFYAATEMNPRNPLWREAPALNQYIERTQAVLRAGRPDNEVLLYWPVHEIWSGGEAFQFTVHKREWLTEQPVGVTARYLWDKGYGFDYVSDHLLLPMRVTDGAIRGPDKTAWRAVFVPQSRQMPLASFEKLIALADAGATVLFEDQLPQDVPGLGNLDFRRLRLQQMTGRLSFAPAQGGVSEARVGAGRILIGPLEPLLEATGISRERLVDHRGLKFVRRIAGGERFYFIVNHGTQLLDAWVPLATSATTVEAMDALSGTTGSVPLRKGGDGNPEVGLRIEPGHALILRASYTPAGTVLLPPLPRPGAEAAILGGPWEVSFLTGGPELPKPFVANTLKSWTDNGDPATTAFGGTALYRTTFDAPFAGNKPWLLDLGEVRHVARLTLNGKRIGSVIMHPYGLWLTAGILKAQGNRLEVEVSNLGANRLRDLDRRKVTWRIFHDINFASINYKPFDAAHWPVMESGLLGPVRVLSVDSKPLQYK